MLYRKATVLYTTLFSREEIFAKIEFEVFSREDIFANILFPRKYLPAKISLASYNADVKYDDRRREDIGGVFSESNKRDDSGAQRWCDVGLSTTTTGDTANRNDSDVTT